MVGHSGPCFPGSGLRSSRWRFFPEGLRQVGEHNRNKAQLDEYESVPKPVIRIQRMESSEWVGARKKRMIKRIIRIGTSGEFHHEIHQKDEPHPPQQSFSPRLRLAVRSAICQHAFGRRIPRRGIEVRRRGMIGLTTIGPSRLSYWSLRRISGVRAARKRRQKGLVRNLHRRLSSSSSSGNPLEEIVFEFQYGLGPLCGILPQGPSQSRA